MWGELIKWAAAAVAAYFASDVVSRVTTDKGLHEHIFQWWNNMRDTIQSWCDRNQSLGITRVVGYANQVIDNAAVAARRLIAFVAQAETRHGPMKITEAVVSADEVAQLFPGIVGSTSITIR